MNLEVLPLAVTMMAGPQILSAIVLVTSARPIRASLGFLLGVALAATLGVTVTRALAGVLGDNVDLGGSGDSGSTGTVVQLVLVALLVVAAFRSYLHRETAEPPKWLGTLIEATPARALATGSLLILLMPSDLVVLLTVGTNLEHNGSPVTDALPFLAATVLIAALPLLAYLVFRRRAERVMPQVRDWMAGNSWVVTVVTCGIFVALILG